MHGPSLPMSTHLPTTKDAMPMNLAFAKVILFILSTGMTANGGTASVMAFAVGSQATTVQKKSVKRYSQRTINLSYTTREERILLQIRRIIVLPLKAASLDPRAHKR